MAVAEQDVERKHKREEVAGLLGEWRALFEATHKRKPSRGDMFSDPVAAALFADFSKLGN